jgi:lipoprotein-releasing system permease protein
MKYEYNIAWRHLTHRKGRGFISLISFISIAGIVVGVMALIVVLSVMSGFDRELKSKIIGAHPHLLIVAQGGIENPEMVVSQVASLGLNGIKSIAPYVEGQTLIRSEENATGVVIKGLAKEDESLQGIRGYIKQGSLDALFEKQISKENPKEEVAGIALGYYVARGLNVRVGDAVAVISPTLDKEGLLSRRVKTKPFIVQAIFEFGMNSMDTTLALVPLESGQDLFNLGSNVSGIALRIEDVFHADLMKKEIQSSLGYPYWTQSWIDMNRSFFSALQVEKNVMTILLFLIILVAGFNIVSTLIMVVMEKTKDIGILKALGATKRSIVDIFIMQGFVVGFTGVMLGLVLGLALTFNLNAVAAFLNKTFGIEVFPSDIYYFNEIPTQINVNDIVIIVVSALLISILAGLYPARTAAGLNPVEALRYE